MKPFSEKLKNMLGDAAFQTAELPVEKIRFGEDIVAACASNACGRYGKFWTCPPGVGTLEELKAKYSKYRTAFVFTTKHELEDSFDFEGMMRGGKEHQRAESLIFDEVKAAGGALLGAGGRRLSELCGMYLSDRALPFPGACAPVCRGVRNQRCRTCARVRGQLSQRSEYGHLFFGGLFQRG